MEDGRFHLTGDNGAAGLTMEVFREFQEGSAPVHRTIALRKEPTNICPNMGQECRVWGLWRKQWAKARG